MDDIGFRPATAFRRAVDLKVPINEPSCPVEATYAEGDLPDIWERFVQINANH
jgi:hypothetical protein